MRLPREFPAWTNTIPWVLIVSLLLSGGCSYHQQTDFDIGRGSATITLKEFAKQAGVEIVFDAESVEGVSTNPVRGTMAPRQALEKMLEGSPLAVNKDSSTGAFAINTKPARQSNRNSKSP